MGTLRSGLGQSATGCDIGEVVKEKRGEREKRWTLVF